MSRRFFLIPVIVLSLAVSSAFASEKDELALVMRQLDCNAIINFGLSDM